mgnify:FL=1
MATERKLSLSEVGKLVAAIMVGLGVGGGIVGVGSSKAGTAEVSEETLKSMDRTLQTLDRISERQLEYGKSIARLETSTEFIMDELKGMQSQIKKNTERNETIIKNIHELERKIPYAVSFK